MTLRQNNKNKLRQLTLMWDMHGECSPMSRRDDHGIERNDYDPKQIGAASGMIKLRKRPLMQCIGITWCVTDSFVVRTVCGITWDPISLAPHLPHQLPDAYCAEYLSTKHSHVRWLTARTTSGILVIQGAPFDGCPVFTDRASGFSQMGNSIFLKMSGQRCYSP